MRIPSMVSSATLLGATVILSSGCADAQVSGRLVDYRSDEPIANASITLSQRGWGLSDGQPVWDKIYTASTVTSADGSFELEFPRAFTMGSATGTLTVEAAGWQSLVGVPVSDDTSVRLQTVRSVEEGESVPGGTAALGVLEDGTPVGWSFVANATTADPLKADILPLALDVDPLRLTLAVPPGGGLLFVPASEQRIAARSHGHLLRYMDEAPQGGYADTLVLNDGTPGTVFVRTPYGRYAKLGFDPLAYSSGSVRPNESGQSAPSGLMLPFAYNPRPGRGLAFDPSDTRPVFAEEAAALADVPESGAMAQVARRYRITMHDDSARLVDSLEVTLQPGVATDLVGTLHEGSPRFNYQNVRLTYDDDGLPRVQLSVDSEHSVQHGVPVLVSRRRVSVIEVQVYAPDAPMRRFELRLQEAGAEG